MAQQSRSADGATLCRSQCAASGARSYRDRVYLDRPQSNRLGEGWDNQNSADGHFETFIRLDLAESPKTMPLQIAVVLAHELTHAAVGIEARHGQTFARVAKVLGLTG